MMPFTLAEASRQIASRRLSPVELVKESLQLIERLNPQVNAFITVTSETALASARAAEKRIMRDGPRSSLDGIPIAHKDLFDTAGVRTTAHSRLLENNIPVSDATVVAKLDAAGSIMLGKLATLEFALGGPSFDLPWPPARNPWNIDYFTGGSSSGTAAAIATGMILGGTGTDTAGSIRVPSAFCGVSGIKPTYGRCSRAGVYPLAFSLDTAGPMAWTVEDCAILLQHMAGYDPADTTCANESVPDFSVGIGKGVKGLHIGVIRHFFEKDNPISDAAHQAIERSLDALRAEGAVLQDVKAPPLAAFSTANRVIMNCEAAAIHEHWMRTRSAEYGERLRYRLMLASLISGIDYIQAQRRRRELCAAMKEVMENVDVVITAVVAGEASPIHEIPMWDGFEKASFAAPWNLTGYPAMTVCTGFGSTGLPLALQIGGRPFDEATIFQVADTLERTTSSRRRRPSLPGLQKIGLVQNNIGHRQGE
ncbi:amidase [Paraburkholderia aspalathi]|uniref:amidase n=1 Tax=Paraburkholderia aspalathi TaxID=1324617 RepID=UPI001B2D18BC|nr:amidase [Paraburkholderia aspalathi]CAE6737766.1 Glutamyl-tRNA(Gln) amidotransferase subunit A [Paraburkholderia aspalathi]